MVFVLLMKWIFEVNFTVMDYKSNEKSENNAFVIFACFLHCIRFKDESCFHKQSTGAGYVW